METDGLLFDWICRKINGTVISSGEALLREHERKEHLIGKNHVLSFLSAGAMAKQFMRMQAGYESIIRTFGLSG